MINITNLIRCEFSGGKMIHKKVLLNMLGLVLLFLTACTPAAKTPGAMMETKAGDEMMTQPTSTMMAKTEDGMMKPTEAMMEASTGTPVTDSMDAMQTPTDDMMHSTPSMADDAMGTPSPASGMDAMMPAKWVEVTFTDPVTEKTFKVNDFKGKVVLVETFAQWCTTCLTQQKEIMKLHEMQGMNSDLVSLSLDIDPNEDAGMLKAYLAKHGQNWNFAIAPADVSREISQLYGNQFLNPPSAPMLIIDRNGDAHPLPFGVKSAADLQKALEPFLKEGM
jgi:hypothetical protein